jgi:3',5'-cyclic AMP phosphodiesterase CpdA
VAVLGLNTARRMGTNLDWSRGRITTARLNHLLARLDALPAGLVRIVVAHHPLLPPPGESTPQIVGNAKRALAAFAAHGVRLVLAGHLHRSYARLSAPEDKAPLILQGGSATSTRLRGETNAYNRILVTDTGEITIEGRVWMGGGWVASAEQRVEVKEAVLF